MVKLEIAANFTPLVRDLEDLALSSVTKALSTVKDTASDTGDIYYTVGQNSDGLYVNLGFRPRNFSNELKIKSTLVDDRVNRRVLQWGRTANRVAPKPLPRSSVANRYSRVDRLSLIHI